MGRFFGMILRVAIWTASGAALGYVGMMVYEMAFMHGVLNLTSTHAMTGATAGAAIFAVIGFFKRA